ncbi:ATP-binding protein [Motiliproteus sp.]|uniref:ATP-binding protein n=1 Tax=Motiliproteus sp. TaxID=1898955 RepID=UPI003BAAC87F
MAECSSCAARLPLCCQACGQALSGDSALYCCGCGAALGDQQQTTPSSIQEDLNSSHVERRQLTVMFCDLVGSTALSQGCDPEDFRDLIHRFQHCCTEVIEQFDGYIARYMGDGMLVYFGYPRAGELDAERAVRAGLELTSRVGLLPHPNGKPLQARVGIETGLVVAGDVIGQGAVQEHEVLGDTPNIAARLQAVAEPGWVVIGPGTRRVVDKRFRLQPLGDQQLKGINQPLATYRAIAVAGALTRAKEMPLLGREREIDQLESYLNRESRDGLLVIEGGSGLGKSRLLDYLLTRASGRYERVLLRCSPFFKDRPLYPVVRHWQSLLELDRAEQPSESDSQRFLGEFLTGHGVDDPELHRWISVMALGDAQQGSVPSETEASSPEQWRRAKLNALLRVLKQCSRKRPLLIAIEDAHWIDSSTAEFLNQLTARLSRWPILLCITSRAPLTWLAGPSSPGLKLPLTPLSDTEALGLIQALDSQTRISPEIRQQILQRCEGSPLYIEELTRSVLEQGEAENQEVQVPSSLQDSLRARIDRLGSHRDVAQFIAVLGRRFSQKLVDKSTPFEPHRTRQALAALVESGLLHSSGEGGRRQYRFHHMMVREVAYDALLKSDRRAHHLRIAQTLCRDFTELVESAPELAASHYESAGEVVTAIEYWHQAGLRAGAAWAHREAANHFLQAVRLLEAEPTTPELAKRELLTRIELVQSLRILELGEQGLEQVEKSAGIAEQLHDDEALAQIHNLWGNLLFSSGAIEGCLSHHRQAFEYADKVGSVVNQIQAHSGLGDASLLAGKLLSAEQAYDRCLSLCHGDELQRYVAPNLSLRGHMRLYLNRLPESVDDITEAITLAVARQDRRTEMVGRGSCLAKTLCEMGQYQRARGELELALETARSLKAKRFEALYLLTLARVIRWPEARCGDHDPTPLRYAEQAIKVAEETHFSYVGAIAFGALALVTEDEARCRNALEQGEALLRPGAPSQNYFWFLRDAIETCLLRGWWGQAQDYGRRFKSYTRHQQIPWSQFYIRLADSLATTWQQPVQSQPASQLVPLQQQAKQAGLQAAEVLIQRCLSDRIHPVTDKSATG